MNLQGTHILFIESGPTGKKTERWNVFSKYEITENDSFAGLLGQVKWFGRWRKYSFFPVMGAIFEEICLRDIAQFCVDATKEHRQRKKAA